MNSRRIFVLITLAVVAMGFVVLSFLREPHYRGRSLSSWLQQCSDTPLDETQRLAEAQTAIRAMPVKKVLPRLLDLVEAKDDAVSLWMIAAGTHLGETRQPARRRTERNLAAKGRCP